MITQPVYCGVELNEQTLLQAAERINHILHEGAIHKDQRAGVLASLLLALLEDAVIDLDVSAEVLVRGINARVDKTLKQYGKPALIKQFRIRLPASGGRYGTAIMLVIKQLMALGLPQAMQPDLLGRFYEVFLKYGNSAKDIGIVLTPRHITAFAAAVMNIRETDFVFDPACGTGGFLLSALDQQPLCRVCGFEEQESVLALAQVNMILRGQPGHHITGGSCFDKWLHMGEDGDIQYLDVDKTRRRAPVTRVLMNPPFIQKGAVKKEFHYVEQALAQMEDDGLLFAILPMSVLLKGGEELAWRRDYLLKQHTVLAIVTLPEHLFYPVGVLTLGLFVKKGRPHPLQKQVFWAKVNEDGFIKSKGRRLRSDRMRDELKELSPWLMKAMREEAFTVNEPRRYGTAPVDFSDNQLELAPEAYLNEGLTTVENIVQDVDIIVRALVAFLIVSRQTNNELLRFVAQQHTHPFDGKLQYRLFGLKVLFAEVDNGHVHASGELDEGPVPLISCKTIENGTEGYFSVATPLHSHCVTIAGDGSWPMTAFYHPYVFAAKDNVIVCQPLEDLSLKAILFIMAQLNGQRWRFSYGRKCYRNKVDKIKVALPADEAGNIDYNTIDKIVDSCPVWQELKQL